MALDKILSVSVDQAAATTATLIPAVAGKKIQVTGLLLSVANGAIGTKSTLQDETANTVRMTFTSTATGSAIVYSYSAQDGNYGIFETAIGEGLELVSGASATIAGLINYRYIN